MKTHGEAGGRCGMGRSAEYSVWAGMKRRCFNPNESPYPHYGGRGITVCERWMQYANFLADMGRRPSRNHEIDRIDNDGNYEPGNCRWALRFENRRNRPRKWLGPLLRNGQFRVSHHTR